MGFGTAARGIGKEFTFDRNNGILKLRCTIYIEAFRRKSAGEAPTYFLKIFENWA